MALPGMLAVTLAWPAMLAVLAAQAACVALPTLLLRQRLHPADAVAWAYTLPLPATLAWSADALAAGLITGPLAGLYTVSASIWLVQWPDWLRPVAAQAITATVLSLLLGWALATLALARRRLRPSGAGLRSALARMRRCGLGPSVGPDVGPYVGTNPGAGMGQDSGTASLALGYTARAMDPLLPALWYRLFWLPFWRTEQHIGVQQCLLLTSALGCTAAWLLGPKLGLPLPAAAMGGLASATLILLTDRGDQAVREQSALLAPLLALWPLDAQRLLRYARLCSLLPAAAVLAAFAALAPHHSRATLLWLACAAAASAAIVGLTLAPRGRVVLVLLSMLILTAIGSEL